MQEYVEIRQLFEAYKAGKQAFPHPVAATTLDIDGEHLVIVLMHPVAYKAYEQTLVVDPRSARLDLSDTPPAAGADGDGTGSAGGEKSKPR